MKAEDPLREQIYEFLQNWRPLRIETDQTARSRSERQWSDWRSSAKIEKFVRDLVGTRTGGFVMTLKKPVGRWGATDYAVNLVNE
jgi:hypothetical protein